MRCFAQSAIFLFSEGIVLPEKAADARKLRTTISSVLK